MKLADPNFNIPSDIEIIIGAEIYESLRIRKFVKHGNLRLINSVFGYDVSTINSKNNNSPAVSHILTPDDCLRNFWLTEEMPLSPKNNWTQKAQDCSKHYDETTTRADDGKVVVEMPFIKPMPKLGVPFKRAKHRFEAQERCLQKKNPVAKEQYNALIKEF